MKLILIILITTLHVSFLHAEESSYKFTFGGNLGNVPIKINMMSKNMKISPGINLNSWILSPNFLFFSGNNKFSNFLENTDTKRKENLFIKFNFKF